MRSYIFILGIGIVTGCKSKSDATPVAPSASATVDSASGGAPRHDLEPFLAWVSRHRADPGKLSHESLECFGPSDPEAGWCDALIAAGGHTWSLRYRKDKPAAVRFEERQIPKGTALTCAMLGPAKKGPRWASGPQQRQRCSITGGPLVGLEALLIAAPMAGTVSVFSAEYLAANPSFEAAP